MSLSGFQRRRRELAAQEEQKAMQDAQDTQDAQVTQDADTTKTTKPFAEMTKKELTAYATANKIELGAAKTNAEIIAVIEEHEKGKE